jgi:hypothetical protein
MRAKNLGEALQDAGFDRAEAELGAAIIKYFKSGGTIARGHELIDAAAERMPGMGHHSLVVSSGRSNCAPTRQPVEDGEAIQLLAHGYAQPWRASHPIADRMSSASLPPSSARWLASSPRHPP